MSLEYSRRYNGGAGFEPLRSVAVSIHVAANNLDGCKKLFGSSRIANRTICCPSRMQGKIGHAQEVGRI